MEVERYIGSVGVPICDVEYGCCFLYGNTLDLWLKIETPEEIDCEENRMYSYAVNLAFGIVKCFDIDDLVQPVDAKVVIKTNINADKE